MILIYVCSLTNIFDPAQEVLNFTYILSKPADGEWGVKKEDGITFTGMVGELADDIIDIGQ